MVDQASQSARQDGVLAKHRWLGEVVLASHPITRCPRLGHRSGADLGELGGLSGVKGIALGGR